MTQRSPEHQIAALDRIVQRHKMESLAPLLEACRSLQANSAPLDVAVFGQFKAGKSSLLNAIVGEAILPVGVIPVTAVITRLTGGPRQAVVTRRDGTRFEIDPGQVADYVSEAANPGNAKQVSAVDISTPRLDDLPGVRLVDTPGLGSVLAHNTQETRDWLPNVAAALVVVSAERPLSAEDSALITELVGLAPRVVLVLSKIDLVDQPQRAEVERYVGGQLRDAVGHAVPILTVSVRQDAADHVSRLRDKVLTPISVDAQGEKRSALELKLTTLAAACDAYLRAALAAADRTDADRARLHAAVFDESVSLALARDELALAEQRLAAQSRPAFESPLLAQRNPIGERIAHDLKSAMKTWSGNLARQVEQYETWMRQRMSHEIEALSLELPPVADNLVAQAEARFRRITEAVRDRLARNLTQASGVELAPVAWRATRPRVAVAPISIGRIFDTSWDLVWWLIPMSVFGGLFRRHCVREVAWETEKNLIRLAGAWADATMLAVNELRRQSMSWIEDELNTLERMLSQDASRAEPIRADLSLLESMLKAPATANRSLKTA